MNFFEKLTNAIERNQSLLCVGLDPTETMLPEGADIFSRLVTWGTKLVEDTSDLVCCYKPNMGFFEQFGPKGVRALVEIIETIPPDIPLLLDAKRGDIGSTAEAYARGIFDHFHADAVTLSPYLGADGVKPFLKYPDKAAFILVQTSNPSAQEIQLHGEPPLYEFIAQTAKQWGSVDQIGLVVGATKPEALQKIRKICPEHWFLAPGVGAQGGDLTQALQAGLRADGLGMIIPVSRSVIAAADPRQAAKELRDAINEVRQQVVPTKSPSLKEQLVLGLFEAGCVKFGNFTLASGKQSPIYIDLRRVVSFSALFKLVAEAYLQLMQGLEFDLVAGVPYAALPTSAILAWKLSKPLIYPRKEQKTHGTGQAIEGVFTEGQRAILIEDVITSGGSILTAAESLRSAGLQVSDALVLVDRKQGGVDTLAEQGLSVHAVLDIDEMLEILKDKNLIKSETLAAVKDYLQA